MLWTIFVVLLSFVASGLQSAYRRVSQMVPGGFWKGSTSPGS
jgi:hypothetical protein